MKKLKIESLGWHDGWIPRKGGTVYKPSTDKLYLISQIKNNKVELLDCADMIRNQFGYCDIEWSLSSDVIPCFNFGIDIIMPDISQQEIWEDEDIFIE